jgi:hypothetical protein
MLVIGWIALAAAVFIPYARSESNSRPTIANDTDFRRAKARDTTAV